MLAGWVSLSYGAPRIPSQDGMVLERVPAAAITRPLAPLRAYVAAHPDDQKSALTLAESYLQIGRSTADPRFISYSQALVDPWLKSSASTPHALVLGATGLQYLHQFDASLGLLDRALAADPANPQALITKATILQVQGRFDEARATCRGLFQAAGQLIALTCVTGVNSLTGQLQRSYDALRVVFQDDPRLPAPIRTWVLGQLAEMAVRRGDLQAARAHLQEALAVAPGDIYLISDFADLLLLENRPGEVVQRLKGHEAQDNLLLRLAIAGTRLKSREGRRWSELFQARFEAARKDRDFTHLREQARFFLEVRSDPPRALELAQENWRVQREPADVRVYVHAAAAAQSASAAGPVRSWIASTHYEDHTLSLEPVGAAP